MARPRWTSGVRTIGKEPCWLDRSEIVRLSGTCKAYYMCVCVCVCVCVRERERENNKLCRCACQ